MKVTLKFSSTHSMISDSLLTDFLQFVACIFLLFKYLVLFFSLNMRNSDCLAIECLGFSFPLLKPVEFCLGSELNLTCRSVRSVQDIIFKLCLDWFRVAFQQVQFSLITNGSPFCHFFLFLENPTRSLVSLSSGWVELQHLSSPIQSLGIFQFTAPWQTFFPQYLLFVSPLWSPTLCTFNLLWIFIHLMYF